MDVISDATIFVASYAVCALAYILLFLLVLSSRTRTLYRNLMLLACAMSGLWALSLVAWPLWGWSTLPSLVFEFMRDGAWLAFVASLYSWRGAADLKSVRMLLVVGVAMLAVIGVGVDVASVVWRSDESVLTVLVRLAGTVRLLIAIVMLLILENLFRNASPDGRWALKYLCIALGVVFSYDFLMYADFVLFLRFDTALIQARGLINALAVVPLAVSVTRAKHWKIDIQVSRNAVFHSVVLSASGTYLVVVAAAGYYLREFGGNWGEILQIFLVAAALILLSALFVSDSLRSQVRVFISKNFYSHKYDYRVEWLRFIQAMSISEEQAHAPNLHERVLIAVTEVLNNPAGGLWVLREQDGAYICTESRAFGEVLPAIPMDHPLVHFLEEKDWIVLLPDFKAGRDGYEGLELPEWMATHARAWMIVPLIHRNTLRALLVMDAPLASQSITWEDFNLLKTIARQAAGFLAEEHVLEVLSDSRKLEAFNRRFAFVVHDIKNLVSQMSLMMKNAEQHGDNPEFQKDMLATVSNSVVRMKAMLEQLNSERHREMEEARSRVAVRGVVKTVGEQWRSQVSELQLELGSDGGAEVQDGDRLSTILDHLLQNAVEAAGVDARIALKLRANEQEAIIEIEDDGPGMDPEFVRDHLFSPFETSKSSGFGLGAYQTREMIRELGGRLEVDSEPGRGTIMSVVLPLTAMQNMTQDSKFKVV